MVGTGQWETVPFGGAKVSILRYLVAQGYRNNLSTMETDSRWVDGGSVKESRGQWASWLAASRILGVFLLSLMSVRSKEVWSRSRPNPGCLSLRGGEQGPPHLADAAVAVWRASVVNGCIHIKLF